MTDRFYVGDLQRWETFADTLRLDQDPVRARCYEGACLLPPIEDDERKRDDTIVDAVYRGGIRTAHGQFISARMRTDSEEKPGNLSCTGDYEIDHDNIPHRDERVLFGGVLYRHFGHMIADGFARLWYLVNHNDFEQVVFFECPFQFASDFDPFVFLKLLGLSEDAVEIIRAPTTFREVIVPDEAFRPFGRFCEDFILPFDRIKDRLPKGHEKKIYLSRTAYQAVERDNPNTSSFIYNEQWYEEFYRRHGYAVIHPDQLSVEEQISIIAGADKIVSTVGTMTHLLLFASQNVDAVILNRADVIGVQMRIDLVRGIKPTYIEATSNPLPVVHARGPFLMMPNRHFKRYLDDCGIEYDQEELDISDEMPRLMHEFLLEWARVYRTKSQGRLIANHTMFDVIRQMNEALYGEPGHMDDYREADRLRESNAELRARNERLRTKNKQLRKENKALAEKSGSKPIKTLKKLLRETIERG